MIYSKRFLTKCEHNIKWMKTKKKKKTGKFLRKHVWTAKCTGNVWRWSKLKNAISLLPSPPPPPPIARHHNSWLNFKVVQWAQIVCCWQSECCQQEDSERRENDWCCIHRIYNVIYLNCIWHRVFRFDFSFSFSFGCICIIFSFKNCLCQLRSVVGQTQKIK